MCSIMLTTISSVSRTPICIFPRIVGFKCVFSTVAPKISAQAVGKKRFRMPVETDVNKLMNYCCGANYYKTGEEIALKDDSEYPDWLWDLSLKPPKLHEFDPSTKEYWEKAAIVGQQREWKLRKITWQRNLVVNKDMINDMEIKYRHRFRALAKYHYNAGHEVLEHHEREDTWNMHQKEQFKLPPENKPFTPTIDKLEFPLKKKPPKVGHFGY